MQDTENQILKHSSKYYLYRVNNEFVKLEDNFCVVKRTIQTLADISGKNIFLYYVNYFDEIYFVREIKSMYNNKTISKCHKKLKK